jgi:polyisoprenoid-binding protein YceI
MKTIARATLLALTLAVVLAAAPVRADTFVIDQAHSSVGFEVRHLAISKVRGSFDDFAGSFTFTPGQPGDWSVEATAQAASINTNNGDRDDHLRSADFFEVEKYPTLTFKSTAVEMDGENEGTLRGELTMHGVTRVVEFDLEFLGSATDPWGNEKAGFSATTEINRKDYGLNWNKALEAGGLVVGEDVKIILEIQGTKEK